MNSTHIGKAALALVFAAGLAACSQQQETADPAPAAADVNVTTPPDVNITQPPADVNINPPDVNINPPDVNVDPPGTTTTRESTTVEVPGVGSTTTTTTEKR